MDTNEEEEKKDEDDNKSIDLEQTDDEETDDEFMHGKEHVQDDDEEMDNEFVHGDKQVNDDEYEKMTNSKVEESGNGDEEITDAAKVLQRHTAKLIRKYSVKPALEPSKIQTPTIELELKSKKSTLDIFKIKKEQTEKQKILKYTIKSTDKAALKEYDQKIALYQTVNENKNFNRNSANHALYHALMEALIEDENAIDKGITDTVKNHKRQHDDDDEDPSAGPNQGKKTKRRRIKESKSSMKPSTINETSRGRAPTKSSKTCKSATVQELIEEPIAEVEIDDLETTANEDVINDNDHPQDYVELKTNKPSRDNRFKQPPRPPTPDP
nr:hypothetical protein [Tanacetum cinerariifolium]